MLVAVGFNDSANAGRWDGSKDVDGKDQEGKEEASSPSGSLGFLALAFAVAAHAQPSSRS